MASAGVNTVRYDLSTRVADFEGMTGLVIGNFDRGRVNTRIFVSDSNQVDAKLGTPGVSSDVAYHILHSYLTKSQRCWVYRVVNTDPGTATAPREVAKYGGIVVGSSWSTNLSVGIDTAFANNLTFTNSVNVTGAGFLSLNKGDRIYLDADNTDANGNIVVQHYGVVDTVTDDFNLILDAPYTGAGGTGPSTHYRSYLYEGTMPFGRFPAGTISLYIGDTKIGYDVTDNLGNHNIFGDNVSNSNLDRYTGKIEVEFSSIPETAVVSARWGYTPLSFSDTALDIPEAVFIDPEQYNWDGRKLDLELKAADVNQEVYDKLVPGNLKTASNITDETNATVVLYDGNMAIAYADDQGVLLNTSTSTALDMGFDNEVNYVTGAIQFKLDGYTVSDPTGLLHVKYKSLNSDLYVVYGDNQGSWCNATAIQIIGFDAAEDSWTINVWETKRLSGQNMNFSTDDSWNVSTKSKLSGYGVQMEMTETVNENSDFIRVNVNDYLGVVDAVTDAISSTTMPHNSLEIGDSSLLFMSGGDNGDRPFMSESIKGLQAFSNKEDVKVNIVMDTWGDHRYHIAIDNMVNRTKGGRGDAYGVLYTPFELSKNTNYSTEIINFRKYTQNLKTEWCGLYMGHVKIYDTYNGREIWIPPSGFVASAFSYTADQFEAWFPAAGWNRGVLPVLDVYRRLTKGERDVLADNDINTMRFKPGKGIAIWGQKTLYGIASALDRANVSWLLIVNENAVEDMLDNYVFEFNDSFTRNIVRNAIEVFYDSVRRRRGVYDYKIVCDDSNNPSDVIDNYKMYVDVYVQPVKSAEFITQRVIITRTGVSFGSVSIA